MQKEDFINRIINLFPSSFKTMSRDEAFDNYDTGISDNLDFDMLFKKFAENYEKDCAPRPAYFKQFYGECQNKVVSLLDNLPETKRAALVQIANWLNSDDYTKCLYEKKKAPPEIRMLQRKYQFSAEELDMVRTSGNLG